MTKENSTQTTISETRRRQQTVGTASIGISCLQREFVTAALEELSAAGHAPDGCQLTSTTIRNVSPADAALLLVYIQNRHEAWLGEAVSSTSRVGAEKSVRSLVGKLLSVARPQVVILHRQDEQRTYRGDEAAVILRLSPAMLQSIAELAEVSRRHGLSYAVRPLDAAEHTYRVRYVLPPDDWDYRFTSDLCVSASALWVRSRLPDSWSSVPEETVRVPLAQVLPVADIPHDVELPPLIPEARAKPYRNRLQALKEEERTHEKLERALYDVEAAVPADVTTMAERLWFDDGKTPFSDAREAAQKLADRLEAWERALETERQALCRDILGVRLGDDVLVMVRDKPVRLRVDHLDVRASDSGIYFTIYGKRFRKDGVLGKRDDMAILHVGDPTSERK